MEVHRSKSNFNQALWLAIGKFSTFLIAFFSAPVLSRYFSETEYGTYRQILYVYTSLQSLFILGLPSAFAFFIPRLNNGQQKRLINSLTGIFFFIGMLLSLCLFVGSGLISELLNNKELETGLKVFSVFPMFTLPTMGIEGIYTAIRKTKVIAIYQIISRLLMFVCIIVPVIVWKSSYIIAIIGWGCASFLTFIMALYLKNKPYAKIKAEKIPNLYRDVFSYTLPLTGAFIAGFLCNSADQFFVSRYFGPKEFALFSNGCFSIPIIGMVAGSVKSVLLPLFSKADHENKLSDAVKTYNSAVNQVSLILLPILFFSIFFAGELMVGFFGEKYLYSKNYFYPYIIRDFLQILPYFAVLMALGYTKLYMYMHIYGALAIWLLDFLIVKTFAFCPLIVMVSSLFHLACTIIAFRYIFRHSHMMLLSKQLASKIIKTSIHCIAVLCLVVFIKNSVLDSYNVYLVVCASAIIFYILLFVSGRLLNINYLQPIFRLISKRNG